MASLQRPSGLHIEHIPDELKQRPQWVTWIWPAPTKKLPCSVPTGEVADAHDPTSWGTFAAAVRAYTQRRHAGIGFVITADDPYVGIDLDDCLAAGTIVHPDAHAIVDTIGGWWDLSPSGTGLKTIVRGEVPGSATGRTAGGLKVEIYPAKRFFTLTGQSFEGRPAEIGTVTGVLTQLYAHLKPYARQPQNVPRPVPQEPRDADHARRYALAALEAEQHMMLAAGDGERHTTRCKAAYALAGYLPHITAQEIFDALAVNFGDDRKTAEQTIWDGIAAGSEVPRAIPEPAQPTFDVDGYACCPTHGARLIACHNRNGYRCPAPKLGEPLCCWWRAAGYTPPDAVSDDDLDTLDPNTLRRRLRAVIAERDRWKARAEQLERELGQVQERNRFVTQAAGAEGIHSPSMRLTFIELKKELDRVPLEERAPDQFVQVRPAYMAACSNQHRSNISNHLAAFTDAGLIEKKVDRVRDPETGAWSSATYVRPLVDLSDPTKVVIPAKPRGKQACKHCGSEQLVREVKVYCAMCAHVQSHDVELVNPPEPEMQTALQEALPSAGQSEGLNCNVQHKEKTVDLSCELQFAIQEVPAPDVQPALQTVSRPVAWIARRTTVAERRQADDEREAACWRYLQQGRLNTATLHAGGMHDHERGKHLIARLEQQAGRRSGHDRGGGPEP